MCLASAYRELNIDKNASDTSLNLYNLKEQVMLLRSIVLFSLTVFSASTLADTVDVNLRDNSAQFQYKSSLGRDALGNTEFHAGALYADKNNMMADFGLLVKDDLGDNAPGFSVGVGIKGISAKVSGNSNTAKTTAAMALGGFLRYSPPATPRLGVVGQIYLSPNITTFGDADRYVEATIRGEYEVIPAAVVYLGYRRIGFGIKNSAYAVLDEGGFLGVRLSF